MKTQTVYALEVTIQQGAPTYFEEILHQDFKGVSVPEVITNPELSFVVTTTDFYKAAHYEAISEARRVQAFLSNIGYGYFGIREHEYHDGAVEEAMGLLNS